MGRILAQPTLTVEDAPMRFDYAIDQFINEMRAEGRIRSDNTERSYRRTLEIHGEDIDNRDPGKVGKRDVARTLSRWHAPNTRRQRHACLTSFYDWCVYNDLRTTNPARMVRPTKFKEPEVRRITREEAIAVWRACVNHRERWAIGIMLLTGARREEVCRLTRRDFMREGWIRLHGKRDKVRWVPVLDELAPIVEEILTLVEGPMDYVIPSRITADGRTTGDGRDAAMVENPRRQLTGAGLYEIVHRVGERAGIPVELSPHVLRRFYAEMVLSYAGQLAAQTAMGHDKFDTTLQYTGGMSMEALEASMRGLRIGYRELSREKEADSPRDL